MLLGPLCVPDVQGGHGPHGWLGPLLSRDVSKDAAWGISYINNN